jgi:hypothetical protein
LANQHATPLTKKRGRAVWAKRSAAHGARRANTPDGYTPDGGITLKTPLSTTLFSGGTPSRARKSLATSRLRTYGNGHKAERSFADAVAGLHVCIAQVRQVLAAGHLRSETAQLPTDQANTLIQRIEAL